MDDRDAALVCARARRSAAGGLAVAVCLITGAWADPPVPEVGDLAAAPSALNGNGPASRLASLPAEPAMLPEGTGGLMVLRPPMTGAPSRPRTEFLSSPPGVTAPSRPFDPVTLTDRLLTRMEGEARRRPLDTLFRTEPGNRPADSVLEAERSLHAEKIIGRSLTRTLDQQLEQVARTSWGMAPVFDWLEDISGRRAGREVRPEAAVDGPAPAVARTGLAGSLGFRLGAHPRLVMRTSFLGFRGRIDVPLLEDELRLSVERPLGGHGRATLTGAFPRGEVGRVWLSLNFSF